VEQGQRGLSAIDEFNGLFSFPLRSEELHEAEKRNDVQWRGHSIAVAPSLVRTRKFDEVGDDRGPFQTNSEAVNLALGDWGAWQDGRSFELSLALQKQAGIWSFQLMLGSETTQQYLRAQLSCRAMKEATGGRITRGGDYVSGEPILRTDVPNRLADERILWAAVPQGEDLGPVMSVQASVRFEELESPDEAITRLANGTLVFPDHGEDFLQKPNYVLARGATSLDRSKEIRPFLAKDRKPLEAAWVYQKPRYYVVRTNDGRVGLVLIEEFSKNTRPAPLYLP
jgi:hypothetical protein